MQCARATRHEPPSATVAGAAQVSGRTIAPSQDLAVSRGRRTHGFRVAHCQCAARREPLVRSSNLVRSRAPTSDEVSQPSAAIVLRSAGALRAHRAGTRRPAGWSRGDSNPGPPPCKGGALPAKLRPRTHAPTAPRARPRVGAPGLEPGTSALSGPRSNHLSYAPAAAPALPRHGRPQPTGGTGSARDADPPVAQDGARGQPSRTQHLRARRHRVALAALPAIRGAPARPCHRLATGEPRGSVPTDAGSPPGSLTRVSDCPRRLHSLERR